MPPRLDLARSEDRKTSLSALRVILLAGTVALALGACGRRGQPEPPPDPSAPAKVAPAQSGKPVSGKRNTAVKTSAEPSSTSLVTSPNALTNNTIDDEEEEDDDPSANVSPQPNPTSRKRIRKYQVPKEPFFLDPLL